MNFLAAIKTFSTVFSSYRCIDLYHVVYSAGGACPGYILT